jgi:hypothetical protein
MGSTRPVKETILQRTKSSPEFRASLIGEALELIAENDVQTAKALIRGDVLASMGCETLAEDVDGEGR